MKIHSERVPSRPYCYTDRKGQVSLAGYKGILSKTPKTINRNNCMLDKNTLTTLESLFEYCRRVLGEPRKRGNIWIFPCPFGSHVRPKLSIDVFNGKGFWRCWSCGRHGDIFNLHAERIGMCIKTDFKKIIREIGDILQIPMNEEGNYPQSKRRTEYVKGNYCFTASNSSSNEPLFLAKENEDALWKCVDRIKTDDDICEELANELGLSTNILQVHSFFPERGALGISPDNRLIYIYTQLNDQGALRITGAKIRRRKNHRNPFLRIYNGEWILSKGTMNPTASNLGEVRFAYIAGKAYAPWGIAAMNGKSSVIITEGESDALAFHEALEEYREAFEMDVNEETGLPYEDNKGSFESFLPAVVSISGVNGFPEKWKYLFKGKLVLIAFDHDGAGKQAVDRVRNILKGLCIVKIWTVPDPYKDAREALINMGPIRLIDSLINIPGQKRKAA